MKSPARLALRVAVVVLAFGFVADAQNLVPNPGFEAGAGEPQDWRLSGGAGAWSETSRQGQRGLTVRGNGDDANEWRSKNISLAPGSLYRLAVWGRWEPGASGGTAVVGTGRINRDFRFEEAWRPYRFIFLAPLQGNEDYVRLGQWQVKGRLYFDAAELMPVWASHRRLANEFELGEGESIRGGKYTFRPNFDWEGANYHRPVARNRAGFNSNRWLFSPGTELVYLHRVGNLAQKSAKVRVYMNYHTGGALQVRASRDGTTWQPLAVWTGDRRGGWSELPASLFPARDIWIQLLPAEGAANFQVDTYEYESGLDAAPADAEGKTQFLTVTDRSPNLAVNLQSIQTIEAQGRCQISLVLTNRGPQALQLQAGASVGSQVGQDHKESFALAPGAFKTLELLAQVEEPGTHPIKIQVQSPSGETLFGGETEMRTSFLSDRRYGYWLREDDRLGLWWCESGWKVGRERGMPARASDGSVSPLKVSAARGEYESAQVILHPKQADRLVSAKVGAFRRAGTEAPGISANVYEVAYVRVTQPTDASCLPGWYPDPLPPLRTPLELAEGQNQPLWLTFHVDREAKAGEYESTLELETTQGKTQIPIKVTVFNVTLPKETHLKSALGLGVGTINRYHRLKDPAQQEQVYEKYLRNFADHRISPYNFDAYSRIEVKFEGEGANKRARVDFTKFDAAATRWLGEDGFSSYLLPLIGMGGGTFHSRHLGELEGFKEGTPEHARLFRDYLSQIEQHLRAKGWLDKAYTYWFDEPDPKDYEFVVAGMKRLKDAAPGVKRMLTEQPEPALSGHVDIWCGLTPEWTPEKVRARRAAGEEVWWYLCTGPKAPYVTIFLDHPGTEMRLWPWQSWQYGVTGLLVWETVYWTSPLAYPEPKRQDPWSDPMSWVTGYGNPVGYTAPWGNGDGRFLYPPRGAGHAAEGPILDDPVTSFRWENLRDGIEDYEYFWVLDQALERAQARSVSAAVIQEARQLLTVPPQISRDLTHFTTDPRPILEHRERLARMIERLNAL